MKESLGNEIGVDTLPIHVIINNINKQREVQIC